MIRIYIIDDYLKYINYKWRKEFINRFIDENIKSVLKKYVFMIMVRKEKVIKNNVNIKILKNIMIK